jgi:RNA polymerase sigma-70 factor (ECF subfamily)
MDWLRFARSLARSEPAPDPARALEPLLPRFEAEGRWAAPGPRLASEALPEAERRQLVRAAIDELPDLYRVALLLRDVEKLSPAEAAAALGITESALKVRHHRARQALLTLLHERTQERLH